MLIDTIRKRMKIIIWVIVIAFALSVFFVGAAGFLDNMAAKTQREQAGTQRQSEAQDQLAHLRSQKPVARIVYSDKEAVVTEGQYQRQLLESGISERLKSVPAAYHHFFTRQAVDQLVSEQLLFLEGSRQNINVTTKVLAQVDSIRQRTGAEDAFQQFLKANGFLNDQDFSNYLTPKLVVEELAQNLFKTTEVSDEEIELYYKVNEARYKAADGSLRPIAEVRESIRMELGSRVSDDEIVQYYERHKERFRLPAVMDMRMLFLSKETPRDLDSVKASVTESSVQSYYQQNLRRFLSPERAEVAHIFLDRKQLEADLMITDEALLAYYQNNSQSYQQEEEARASHILLRFADFETEAKAKARAEEIKEKLLTKEIEFSEAAKQFSADPGSKDKGGDLGFFPRGMMVPPFEEYVFSGPMDVISEPVKTEYGYHLIVVHERKPSGTKPFADVRSQVEGDYRSKAVGDLADRVLLGAKAQIDSRQKSFEQLVPELSHAPSKASQGSIGIVFLGTGNEMAAIAELSSGGSEIDEPVLTALKRLKVGESSTLVETRKGFHLLKLNRKLDRLTLPLEKVSSVIRTELEKVAIENHFATRKTMVDQALLLGLGLSTVMTQVQDLANYPGTEDLKGIVISSEVTQNSDVAKVITDPLLFEGRLDVPVVEVLRYGTKASRPVSVTVDEGILYAEITAVAPHRYRGLDEVKDEIRADMTLFVSQEELQEAYDANPDQYTVRGKLVIQQVVYKSESVAQEQLNIIHGGGLKFEDAGRSTLNLDRGSFNRNEGKIELKDAGFFDAASQAAIRALAPGEIIASPIRSNFGWHLVKMVEKSEDRPRGFSEVQAEILTQIRDRKRTEVLSKFIQELRNRATLVEVFPQS